MSSRMLAYSGLTTKVRAMESHFISDDEFRAIVALSDVPAVVAYLKKDPGYAAVLAPLDENNLHRGEIETLLRNTVLYDFERIYRFAGEEQKPFLRRYGRRYEVRFLKQQLARVFDPESIPDDVPRFIREEKQFFDEYSDLHFDALLASRTVEDLIKACEGTPYFDTLTKVHAGQDATLFRYETARDLFHFGACWRDRKETVDKSQLSLLTKFYGTKFDTLNLWYIHRAKYYYHLNDVETYALTIPALYRLTKQDIRALVEAENMDAYERALKSTYYAKKYPELTKDNLQYMYTKICKSVLRNEAAQHPYSIAILYYYLYWKEHEVYRLTTAIECVRYHISPEEAIGIVLRR